MEKEKKTKNIIKKISTLILIIVVFIIISIIIYNKANTKEQKAVEFFGNDNCEAILHLSTRDLAKHKCKICGTEFENSSMNADICEQCAKETDRCEFCAKKLTQEIKQQRQELENN